MRLNFNLAVAACAAALTLTACGGAADTSSLAKNAGTTATVTASPDPAAPASAAVRDVQITRSGFEDHPTWGPHAYVVHFRIVNHTAHAADYYAELEFLDKDGDVLGTTGITADKLGAGKTNTGDTAPLDTEIRNGKITDIVKARVSKVDRT